MRAHWPLQSGYGFTGAAGSFVQLAASADDEQRGDAEREARRLHGCVSRPPRVSARSALPSAQRGLL